MGHSYQPNFANVIQGESNETSEAEILAAVRKILTSEKEFTTKKRAAASLERDARRAPAAHVIKRSLGALVPSRFRS